MPWNLYSRGLTHLHGATGDSSRPTETQAEWKLFIILRRSSGGISGLLLFQFCLSLYVVLWGGARIEIQKALANTTVYPTSKAPSSPSSVVDESEIENGPLAGLKSNMLDCSSVEPWMVSYTTVLFIFRALHEVSVFWWRRGAQRGRKSQSVARQDDDWRLYTGLRLYMWLHIVAAPVLAVEVILGFVILGSTPEICAPRDVYTLQFIFLGLSIPVLSIKWLLHYQYQKRNIFTHLARTSIERYMSNALSPQFLHTTPVESNTSASGHPDSRSASTSSRQSNAWTMTYPITSNASSAKCVICLDMVKVGDKIRDFPCRHQFHVWCIDRWLRDNNNCPSCLRVVKRTTPLEEFQRRARVDRRLIIRGYTEDLLEVGGSDQGSGEDENDESDVVVEMNASMDTA